MLFLSTNTYYIYIDPDLITSLFGRKEVIFAEVQIYERVRIKNEVTYSYESEMCLALSSHDVSNKTCGVSKETIVVLADGCLRQRVKRRMTARKS